MSLMQLTYASHPFGFDDAMLAGILLDARRCNARDGITSASRRDGTNPAKWIGPVACRNAEILPCAGCCLRPPLV